jgi:GR25 family glycosyltransferase involved in LPS biosynthesis
MDYIKKISFLTLVFPFVCVVAIAFDGFFYEIYIAILLLVVFLDIDKFFDLFKKQSNLDIKFRENNSGKISAYVLNLEKASERLQQVLPQIEKLGIPYERISAVDGESIQKEKIIDIVDLDAYKSFFKMLPELGTIGCSLSHEKIWKLFLASDNEFALVFEDDVQFEPCVLAKSISSVIDKKNMWDIVAFELKHRGCPVILETLSSESSLVLYLTDVKHSGAYIINRKAAHRLLQKFYPIKMPLDHYFTRSWEFEIRFCGVEPRIVEQKIGKSQIKRGINKKIKLSNIFFRNVSYHVYTATMRAIYNVYCFICK